MNATTDSFYALTNALQPVKRAWTQAAGSALAVSGISVSLATPILLVSRLGDGVQQNVLAEEVGVHPAAMVRVLDQAQEARLLERRAMPGNRRIKGIYLLPAGRRLAMKMERSLTALRRALMQDIPAKDIDIATRTLRAFEERAHCFIAAEGRTPK